MADSSTTTSTGTIEFIEHHKPGLEDGDYTIAVTQVVSTRDQTTISRDNTFTAARTFSIAGERFELKPSEIQAVFPPEGSLGEHSNVLPHVILNRSTLPWEREAEQNKEDAPWLALLLFDDQEKPHLIQSNASTPGNALRIVTVAELTNPAPGGPRFPALTLERGQDANDKVSVIDVKKSLLEAIMPTWEELKLLAHVRLGKDEQNVPGDELAVIIGNRLPRVGKSSTVHLVSVENRYTNSRFNYQEAQADNLIRLVSLKSWTFACEDEQKSFKGLLMRLNRDPDTLRLPPPQPRPDTKAGSKRTLELATNHLSKGYLALPHGFRQGQKSASWYRGPLIPGENPTQIELPVRASDELLRFDPDIGMFDVSYAAAWELGRLLALQNKQFSTSLFRWKRSHVQQVRQTEQRVLYPHLSHHGKSVDAGSLPDELDSWLDGLALLKGMPFNYLVPDERLLPLESIRFFQVDKFWIECLLDGAFSIGRVTTADLKADQEHAKSDAMATPFKTVTGILLRSEVVRGWPGLLVDAYGVYPAPANTQPLTLLRMERLSANLLICLFEGAMKSVAIHQKPESLHFGLDRNPGAGNTADPSSRYHKVLRGKDGREDSNLRVSSIPFRGEGRNVIEIVSSDTHGPGLRKAICTTLKTDRINSAEFALQMIEGVEKVVYTSQT